MSLLQSNPTRMMTVTAVVLLACGMFMLPGCISGDPHWRRGEPSDVRKAEIGWHLPELMDKIGKPLHMNIGTGVYTSWEEWVYPTGSIFLHRQRITHILPRHPDEPIPPKRPFGWKPKRKKKAEIEIPSSSGR